MKTWIWLVTIYNPFRYRTTLFVIHQWLSALGTIKSRPMWYGKVMFSHSVSCTIPPIPRCTVPILSYDAQSPQDRTHLTYPPRQRGHRSTAAPPTPTDRIDLTVQGLSPRTEQTSLHRAKVPLSSSPSPPQVWIRPRQTLLYSTTPSPKYISGNDQLGVG